MLSLPERAARAAWPSNLTENDEEMNNAVPEGTFHPQPNPSGILYLGITSHKKDIHLRTTQNILFCWRILGGFGLDSIHLMHPNRRFDFRILTIELASFC